MAASTEESSKVQYLGYLLSAVITLIPGLVIHSFIIGVNVNNWWKGRSVTPVDHIVTSLGISRMCAQIAVFLHLFVDTLFLGTLASSATVVIIDLVYAFFNFANIWLTSLLSIVFCLKISNLHTRLFLYLRRLILQRIAYFIVALVLFSAINSLISLTMTVSEVIKAGTYNRSIRCTFKNTIFIVIVGDSIPLFFYYFSFFLLFTSLYNHISSMKMNGNVTINLETYYSVMKFMSVTFVYITLHFIGQFAYVLYCYFNCVALLLINIVLEFFSVVHSSFLIYKTSKLRNQMSRTVQNILNFISRRKDTESRENTDLVNL